MTPTQDESSANYEPYKTSDTPFAAFLHYFGYRILGTKQDPNDYKREVIIFLLDDRIPGLEKDWSQGLAEGNFKKYHRSLKIVNRTINENRRKREN
jgi:hypothetical protein